MREHLHLPKNLDGRVWHYRNAGCNNAQHHHAELELNQVTRGSGTYLLANRKYQIRRGDLVWLFPSQEHVLIEHTADFEMWIAVFKRKMIRRLAIDEGSKPLLQTDPHEGCCRRLAQHHHRKLEDTFGELVQSMVRPGLFNAGLSYLLLNAWNIYQGSAKVPVRDVHPAVERVARLIRENETSLSLDRMAEYAGLSPARLSRLFREQTGMAMVSSPAHF
jgi:quercetin dioxygenase-like cupin family protein